MLLYIRAKRAPCAYEDKAPWRLTVIHKRKLDIWCMRDAEDLNNSVARTFD